jgi:malate dehydrogenase
VRANTFVAENQGFDVLNTNVNVIGGHAGTTILPLLSQVSGSKFSADDISALTNRIQFGGDEVVKAKDGSGSATLSMAYAGQRFTSRLLEAMGGKSDVVECTFVENDLTPCTFFSTPCRLGPNGVEEVLSFGDLSDSEKSTLDAMIPDLKAQAQKGVDFVSNN